MTLLAAAAAHRVASRFGYRADEPSVIQETNNTVMWLRPLPVIAKVGTWRHSAASLTREHEVATALAADAPIAQSIPGAWPTVDEGSGFTVTLWERLDTDPEARPEPREVAGSLRELHRALTGYGGELPSFRIGLDLARTALADDGLMEALPEEDRSFLRDAFDRLRAEVTTHGYSEQPLHGEAHDGNLLITPAGPRWIDLEGVCIGPLEWDLAFLPEGAAETFSDVDVELLELLRTLNSARVATWCWARWRFPELRWHAEFHLERVRRAEANRSG
jgi:thiamine kinase-like enzyme